MEDVSPKKYLDKHSDIAVDVQGGGSDIAVDVQGGGGVPKEVFGQAQ